MIKRQSKIKGCKLEMLDFRLFGPLPNSNLKKKAKHLGIRLWQGTQ